MCAAESVFACGALFKETFPTLLVSFAAVVDNSRLVRLNGPENPVGGKVFM